MLSIFCLWSPRTETCKGFYGIKSNWSHLMVLLLNLFEIHWSVLCYIGVTDYDILILNVVLEVLNGTRFMYL
jgi:hypothetical protein